MSTIRYNQTEFPKGLIVFDRTFAIYQILWLGWVGLENVYITLRCKYCMKANERHHNSRPQPSPRKFRKWLEVRFWPFSADFSWVGLALGCGVRRFHIILTRYLVYVFQPSRIWSIANILLFIVLGDMMEMTHHRLLMPDRDSGSGILRHWDYVHCLAVPTDVTRCLSPCEIRVSSTAG